MVAELIRDLGIILNATLMYTPPLLFAALGSCFSEKSGVVNIGIEGMMLTGAFFAVLGSYFAGSWVAGVACALLSIPQKYMHTPVEVVSLADVEAVADLMAAFLREFDGEVKA